MAKLTCCGLYRYIGGLTSQKRRPGSDARNSVPGTAQRVRRRSRSRPCAYNGGQQRQEHSKVGLSTPVAA
eukprot:3931733-Rhodomonas_salina.5